jgi:hypothetical protein
LSVFLLLYWKVLVSGIAGDWGSIQLIQLVSQGVVSV